MISAIFAAAATTLQLGHRPTVEQLHIAAHLTSAKWHEKTQTILIITYNNIYNLVSTFSGAEENTGEFGIGCVCAMCLLHSAVAFSSPSSAAVCAHTWCMLSYFEWFSCQKCLIYVVRDGDDEATDYDGSCVYVC